MENFRRYDVVFIVYLPVAVIAIFTVGRSEGRELRPSEHGLATADGGEDSPEMRSFFRGRTSTPSPTVSMPMPEAKNMSDASWWKEVSGGGGRRDRAREALVVTAAVCGGVGVAFLVVAALIFVFRCRSQKSRGNGRAK
ncbi:Intron-encoded endonuclease [Actinidia chinensis var. chinensis]|uniref:Intron-encoded endonuclease n=1 Tax=Actinidia chinensis var. chinensis TaxID=1590841 RepID=A0A2R6PYB7_ACTCC|nr:Intron-encoded endonuclease [Actinidia chinensis var. chinensis]